MVEHLRDMANRVIVRGDYIVWGASRQGYGMRLARVTKLNARRVHAVVLGTNKEHHFNPENSLVVTQQVKANIDGNVGGAQKEAITVPESSASSMKSWAESKGYKLNKEDQ